MKAHYPLDFGGDCDDGGLRATDGCLGVDNETAQALADLVEPELAAGRQVFYDCEAPS